MPASALVGIALLVLAIAIDSWGFMTMKAARTNILPHNPAHALVRSGPFRFSRNPLYIGMILGYLSAVCGSGRCRVFCCRLH